MEILNTLFYFVITIGILVFVHEFGHFIAAKLTGMRVDRFSIGFPPRAFGKTVGDTDYCISWIPIGGYVKIAGMVDESFDTDFVKSEPQPWEFRSKPLWARVLVITAGVAMNIFLAIAVFWGINYAQGKYLRATTEVGYVIPESAAEKTGFRAGDRIQSINGQPVTHWDQIQSLIYIENVGREIVFDLERSGSEQTLVLPSGSVPDIASERFGILPAHTVAIVGGVESGKPAEELGLQPRDILVSLNGISVFNENQVIQVVRANVGREITVVWKRDGEVHEGTTVPNEEGRIGITVGSLYTGPTLRVEYSFFGALPEGLKDIVHASGLFYRSILQLITGKTSFSQSFGGPIKIAQIATQSAEGGLTSFLAFMALLSMSLAILNILPFPALDGGHLLVMLLEAIFRREIPHRVKLAIQQVGFFILLAFMAFVIYNDIVNF
jgi:regulator of sigma E protease